MIVLNRLVFARPQPLLPALQLATLAQFPRLSALPPLVQQSDQLRAVLLPPMRETLQQQLL